MSQWLLNGGLPEGLSLGGDVDLEDPQEEGGVIRVRGMYLESDEIRGHIESGKQAVRLALSWQDQVDFVVDKDLTIRRIRFSDEFKGINEELHEDVLARRDADCLLNGRDFEYASNRYCENVWRNCRMSERPEPGAYVHYKNGKHYTVIDVVRHSETEELMVLYRAEYGDYSLWVRP